MFIIAKFFAFVTQPLAWVAFLSLAGLLCLHRQPKWGARLGWSGLGLLVILGWEPLPDAMLRRLENQFPPLVSTASLKDFTGIVVLGGALEPAYVWTTPGQSALNDAAERMTEVLPLLRQQPALWVLFTGGEGELFGGDLSEADRAAIFFAKQGVAPAQLLFESASRTTYENAQLSKHVPGVNAARPWLLMTSAWHMPRAMAVFQKAGWNVTAYPVDFRTGAQTPWSQYSMDMGAKKWKMALHELVGQLAYRFTGRA
jgi:uncharacterized SAM-binding protein YcdF (DUF218 family)